MRDDWFEQAILDMRPTLYRVSYGLLSEDQDRQDAVQEAIFKAWRKRQTLKEPACAKTWVIRILINECHNAHRSRAKYAPFDGVPEPRARGGDSLLRDAITALPEKLRLPIMIHHMEGYTIRETAVILRISQGTCSSRLRRAYALLRIDMEEGDNP